MEVDKKVRTAWFADFESKMTKETRTDILIPYYQLSLAFPSDHSVSDSLDIIAIDTHALEKWASGHRWSVRFAHEKADPKYKSTPPIHFSRVHKS